MPLSVTIATHIVTGVFTPVYPVVHCDNWYLRNTTGGILVVRSDPDDELTEDVVEDREVWPPDPGRRGNTPSPKYGPGTPAIWVKGAASTIKHYAL